MKIDYRKIGDLYKKSVTLRDLLGEKSIPYNQQMKIREEQDKYYKLHKFYKGISRANQKIKNVKLIDKTQDK